MPRSCLAWHLIQVHLVVNGDINHLHWKQFERPKTKLEPVRGCLCSYTSTKIEGESWDSEVSAQGSTSCLLWAGLTWLRGRLRVMTEFEKWMRWVAVQMKPCSSPLMITWVWSIHSLPTSPIRHSLLKPLQLACPKLTGLDAHICTHTLPSLDLSHPVLGLLVCLHPQTDHKFHERCLIGAQLIPVEWVSTFARPGPC